MTIRRLLFYLLSRSEELVGFRRGDYKLKEGLADNENPTVLKPVSLAS